MTMYDIIKLVFREKRSKNRALSNFDSFTEDLSVLNSTYLCRSMKVSLETLDTK